MRAAKPPSAIQRQPARAASRPRVASPAGDGIETEWQFDAPSLAAVAARLRGGSGDARLAIGAPRRRLLRDIYLDTRDWRVFRCGFALRLRRSPDGVEATLKTVAPRRDGLAVRRELTQPVRTAARAAIYAGSGPVAERLRRICRAGELRALAEVATMRRSYPLTWRGKPAGEVTLDTSRILGAAGTGARLERVEVEVPSGLVRELRPFVERLRVAANLSPATRSKYEWALATRGLQVAWPGDLGPTRVLSTSTVGETAYAVLRRHFAATLWHEAGTRLGEDPEALHDMRVATRRMRAALRLFAAVLPARVADRLRRELRALGQALGRVRDLDVQIAQIESWRGALITVEPAALDPFLGLLRERRQAARDELIAFLDSRRYVRLTALLRAWLARGPARGRPGTALPIRAAGPELLRRARRKVVRQGEAIRPASPAADYHRVRILGKRFRYALEFLEPVYGPPARTLIRALVEVQDILGLHQDAQVCMAVLPALAREAGGGLPQATRLAVGEVAQLYAAQAARLRGELPGALAGLRGRNWRELEKTMDAALSELAADVLREHLSRARGATTPGADGTKPAGGAGHGDPDRPPRHRRRARSPEVGG
jgi:CHAD domain-containing protein